MAGEGTAPTNGSPQSATPTGLAGRVQARFEAAGLNRGLAAAALTPAIGAVVTLALVIPTLAPTVLSQAGGDTAEFQTVAWVLGTAHPTGYPAFMILGFIATHLFPFGDPAFRMNLLQACLAAGAVAGTIAVVQFLTGMRWIALATGVLLLTMPAFSTVQATFPDGNVIASSPVFWRLSTYADPHMFHVALVTLIFLLLLIWERRRTNPDLEGRRGADRWLVAAACVFGIAFANHSLTLMLAPAIGLFVLAVAPLLVLQWRLILACAATLVATTALLWLELPIRAAMHAPLVYAHPDTWSGFLYVVMGQQFGGIPATIGDDLGQKYTAVMSLISGWMGPLGYVAALGIGTSLVRRPRYVVLALLAAAVTSAFAASYQNSDLERYYLVPVFVAFSFVGLGLADAVSLGVWLAETVSSRGGTSAPEPDGEAAGHAGDGATGLPARGGPSWQAPALLAVEAGLAAILVAASVTAVPVRESVAQFGDNSGAVSQATQTGRQTWMRAVLALPDQGGLPADAVIVSNWSDSTTLWYGQKVEGLRPDILIVDDSMRVAAGDNLGEVWDVIDRYLGQRPVFLLRFQWGVDGMVALGQMYDMRGFPLNDGGSIPQVVSKKGNQ